MSEVISEARAIDPKIEKIGNEYYFTLANPGDTSGEAAMRLQLTLNGAWLPVDQLETRLQFLLQGKERFAITAAALLNLAHQTVRARK